MRYELSYCFKDSDFPQQFLLANRIKRVRVLIPQSCLSLCDPMDCSPPDSSVHGILQARILVVGCHSLLQGVFLGLLHCRQILYPLSHQESK